MIAKLAGIIDTINSDSAIVDVRGVGYLVFCSARTLSRLSHGQTAQLFIETHVREDHIHLYGFQEQSERDWFLLLTTVQGVGTKVALAILSVLDPEQLLHAIAAADKTSFTQAPGVGPKLAGRLVSELKDKVNVLALKSVSGGVTATRDNENGATRDAVSALVNLGYAPSEAFTVIAQAASQSPDAGIEALIMAGLAELAPKEPRNHSRGEPR